VKKTQLILPKHSDTSSVIYLGIRIRDSESTSLGGKYKFKKETIFIIFII